MIYLAFEFVSLGLRFIIAHVLYRYQPVDRACLDTKFELKYNIYDFYSNVTTVIMEEITCPFQL